MRALLGEDGMLAVDGELARMTREGLLAGRRIRRPICSRAGASGCARWPRLLAAACFGPPLAPARRDRDRGGTGPPGPRFFMTTLFIDDGQERAQARRRRGAFETATP